jgi:hypothetical protein
MTVETHTITQIFAAARARHAAADQARNAAQATLDRAIADRQPRRNIDSLTEDLYMAETVESRALDDLQRAEIAVMGEEAAGHVRASHATISHAVTKAFEFDRRLEEAKAALVGVFDAIDDVALVHGAAWGHDAAVATRAEHNTILGALHSSQQPRAQVGGRQFEPLHVEVDTIHLPSGIRFGRPLSAVLLARYRDLLPAELVVKLLADTAPARAA